MTAILSTFVYGTLRPGEGLHGAITAALLRYHDDVSTPGTLYVAGLPYASFEPDSEQRVIGTLLEVVANHEATEWVNAVERGAGYVDRNVPVTMKNGSVRWALAWDATRQINQLTNRRAHQVLSGDYRHHERSRVFQDRLYELKAAGHVMTARLEAGSKTYDLLGLVNVHDLLLAYAYDTGQPVPPAVCYRQQMTGLHASQSAAWQVIKPGVRTNPHGHWMDQYQKTFIIHSRDERRARLNDALAWAAQQYDVREYVRPDGEVSWAWRRVQRAQLRISGDYVPAAVIEWLERRLASAEHDGAWPRHWWTAAKS